MRKFQHISRGGLRIRNKGGHREVCSALIKFAKWVRANYAFPVRVPVYLYPAEYVVTISGESVAASFFAPYSRKVEPYIRIATGDYNALKRQRGRDNALASFIASLSHELIHYQQWIKTGTTWERGVTQKSIAMLRRYEKTVDFPL